LTYLLEASDASFAALLSGRSPTGHLIAEGGIETDEVMQMLQSLACSVRQDFSPAAWLIVDDERIIGMCSLLSAPDPDGTVAIGYGIAPAYRGKGIGKRAIAALVEWAQNQEKITAITAETATDNGPSQGILLHNGFRRNGERRDPEDGTLFCWRLETA
jgi:RimJ/RimL family protein N-acetyltransferase